MAKNEKYYQIIQDNDCEDKVYLQHYDEVNQQAYFTTYSGYAFTTSEKDKIEKIFDFVNNNFNGFYIKNIEFIMKGKNG